MRINQAKTEKLTTIREYAAAAVLSKPETFKVTKERFIQVQKRIIKQEFETKKLRILILELEGQLSAQKKEIRTNSHRISRIYDENEIEKIHQEINLLTDKFAILEKTTTQLPPPPIHRRNSTYSTIKVIEPYENL